MTFFDILKTVEIPDQMGCYEESDALTPNAEEYISEVLRLAKLEGFNVTYHNGASQLCFIEDGADRVYKLSFDGVMEEWEEENDEYESKEEWRDWNIDFTAKTKEIYDLAVDAGVEEFFADIRIEGMSFNNCAIYSQAFVIPENSGDSSITPSQDSLDEAKKIKSESKKDVPFDKYWIAVCLETYGLDKFNQLLQFIEDNQLSDFHDGNYGYTRKGLPRLLDYCGFNIF